jgi:adenylate cyclase
MANEQPGVAIVRRVEPNKNLVTVESFQRPVIDRARGETIEQISAWLIAGARRNPSFTQMFDEFAWRLVAAGLPLLRASLHSSTLHPQFLGATYLWWRDDAQTQKIMIAHEIVDTIPYSENPVRRVREGGETLRVRLDGPETFADFFPLRDLTARGGTEFFALPIASQFGFGIHVAIYVADRPGGFTDVEIRDLTSLSERLSVIADMNSQRQIAENVLTAYLGPLTGPRVLAGHIRRGSGEAISAVLWSSDLRRFTQLSDRLTGERVIAMLNDLFDLQAQAIADHGGEILKFIGDGLLAIFPVAEPADAPRAAANALAAAREAQTKISALRLRQSADDHPPLEIVVALHYGTVIYGNVGSAGRLDFTVIGPAVNLVNRVETVAKALDLPVVVSDDFATAYGQPLTSLGLHHLRGLDYPRELFAAAEIVSDARREP